MAEAISTTRRSLFAIAAGATLLPAVAFAAPTDHTAAWRDAIASYTSIHPNAPAALARAIKEGLDPTTITSVLLTGLREDHLPAFIFGKTTDRHYTICMPHECGDYRRIR